MKTTCPTPAARTRRRSGRAALITVRRAILERFPPAPWLQLLLTSLFGRSGRNDDRGPVTQHLSGSDHRAGVVSNAHDGICTEFPRVLFHQLKRFFSCSFA